MRTGTIMPFDPLHARQDISEQHVEDAVRIPVGMRPGVAQYGPPPQPLSGFGADDESSNPLVWLAVAALAGISGFAIYKVTRRR